jgi:hypothetical protein
MEKEQGKRNKGKGTREKEQGTRDKGQGEEIILKILSINI